MCQIDYLLYEFKCSISTTSSSNVYMEKSDKGTVYVFRLFIWSPPTFYDGNKYDIDRSNVVILSVLIYLLYFFISMSQKNVILYDLEII